MDAMPVSLSQSLLRWARQIEQNIDFINAILPNYKPLLKAEPPLAPALTHTLILRLNSASS